MKRSKKDAGTDRKLEKVYQDRCEETDKKMDRQKSEARERERKVLGDRQLRETDSRMVVSDSESAVMDNTLKNAQTHKPLTMLILLTMLT